MKITLDKNWRLSATKEGGWDLEHFRALTKGPNKGNVTWAQEGHYDTLGWALHGAWRHMVHNGRSEATASLKQLIERVHQVEARLLEIAAQVPQLPPEPEAPAPKPAARRRENVNPWAS